MNQILITGAWVDGKQQDVLIQGKYISQVGDCDVDVTVRKIDATGKVMIPGFVNCHTHAAMTLFRGYADDMPLFRWLTEKIWPNEAKMTGEDIYWGTKLACLEMIKSGTTTFFDMYPYMNHSYEAVKEMGLRAVQTQVCFDHFEENQREKCKVDCEKAYFRSLDFIERVKFGLGPHAIYTVSGELLKWINDFAKERNLLIHLHLAETEKEVLDSVRNFGLTPVRYLNKLGILSPRLVLAHGLYMDADEIKMLASHGVKVVHNPASNMKLASGANFKFDEMREAGVDVALGTDGCSSSNNLDMIEAMKLASLLGKAFQKNPEAVSAIDIFESATSVGASALGLQSGCIKPGFLADLVLIDVKQASFIPNHNFISNLVYSANGSCVDTVLCDGRVLMENRKVFGEEEILVEAEKVAYDLIKR